MGDHVWLITSRQTEPDLGQKNRINLFEFFFSTHVEPITHSSSMFGWKILLTNPMLGLL